MGEIINSHSESNIKIKKEVSCKTLIPIIAAAKRKKIGSSIFLSGVPYSLSYLSNLHERIEWKVWCRIVVNLRPFFSSLDFEDIGRDLIREKQILSFMMLFSFGRFGKKFIQHGLKIGDQAFGCIESNIEFITRNKLEITLAIKEGYEFLPEFFLITKGVFCQIGQLMGKDYSFSFEWVDRGAVFHFSWGKASNYFKLKRMIQWAFNFKKALLEINESNEELINQYNKLEKSKELLEKQTTILKTTYEITKSIRQSFDINTTLTVIINALTKEAKFSSAEIILFKDIEGNKLLFKVGNKKNNNIPSIEKPVIIDNEKIGKLIIYPEIYIESSEADELFNYLMPIINITIHDSLVLRAISDFKENLEIKVADRTAELKNAQDKLSKTITLLQEFQQIQNRFFTNISHEFRTPLTLILGPVKLILDEAKNPKVKENAELIQRSAKKLNRLANQLLDLSRVEAGKMKLKAKYQNLVQIIKEIVNYFQPFAESKNVSLISNYEDENLMLYIDKDIIDKIMNNILSNAVKFTPAGGKVIISVYKNIDKVTISVTDTGIGIPVSQIDKIFDRFYQADNRLHHEHNGTGIGLSLTKELAELHKGKILVESVEGKGSTFKIILLSGNKHFLPEEIDEENVPTKKIDSAIPPEIIFDEIKEPDTYIEDLEIYSDKSIPSLLIIEDNADVRKYIKEILSDFYIIFEASDGEDGLNKSHEKIPDLVISDVMMPRLNGFQLCNKLKTDYRTSHIPIILLTAKTTIRDKIEGLETGADDYITKPFEESELKARIKNLLDQRIRLHEHFRKFGFIGIENKNITSIDQEFLRKAIEIINNNISNPGFNVGSFADHLAVSRSLLHKKLSALSGESPGELIKRCRLNKAAQMLLHNTANVTQIAFEVGFNDPAYFTVCFKKQFGISPSHYSK